MDSESAACDIARNLRLSYPFRCNAGGLINRIPLRALFELEGQAVEAFTTALLADETHSYTEVYRSILNHIHDNARVWSVLLSGHGSRDFHDRIARVFEDKFVEICAYETGTAAFSQEYRLLIVFETHGFLAMIDRWLEDGTALPVDVLARLLQETDGAIDPLMDWYV